MALLIVFLGHADSWELGHPGLLTECNTKNKKKRGMQAKEDDVWPYGPMNPIKESVYAFLKSFFGEITTVFKDNLLHLGGDEVGTSCW